MKLYAANGMGLGEGFKAECTLVVNVENEIIKKLANEDSDNASLLAKQIYSLASLSQRRFSEAEMKDFLAASYSLLEKLS